MPDGADGAGIRVGSSIAVGRLIGVGIAVAAAVALVVGAPGGTSNRPRRCAAVGDTDAEKIGVAVVMLRGVITDFGVDAGVVVCTGDAIADGDGVDAADIVPPSEAGGFPFDCASPLTNFFGGAFGGGVASDFIFWRVFFASS